MFWLVFCRFCSIFERFSMWVVNELNDTRERAWELVDTSVGSGFRLMYTNDIITAEFLKLVAVEHNELAELRKVISGSF